MKPTVKSRVRTAALLLIAIGVTGSGWVVAARTKSPRQALADATPPTPSILTAPVVVRTLQQSVIDRATVSLPTIPIVPPDIFPAGSVVTDLTIRAGQPLVEGARVMEVSDRPVFVLAGLIPMWRDLHSGDSGRDVVELQDGLARIGFDPGPERGTFDAGTERAVRDWYRAAGYVPASTLSSSATPSGTGPSLMPPSGATAPEMVISRSELVFVPSLPATIAAVRSRLGVFISPQAGEGLVDLSGGAPQVRFGVSEADRPFVHLGAEADLLNEELGKTIRTVVTALATKPTTNSDGSLTFNVALSPRTPIPAAFVGDVRVTIRTAVTKGKVLAVPEAAVLSAPDGTTYVSKLVAGRQAVHVVVATGASADGAVEVRPMPPSALGAGDRVVVG